MNFEFSHELIRWPARRVNITARLDHSCMGSLFKRSVVAKLKLLCDGMLFAHSGCDFYIELCR